MIRENYEKIADTLRQHGLQVTSQRILIYDYLIHTTKHPSAQQVFEDVYASLPGISKATVYNTLEAFSSQGLINKINPQSGVARYDGNTQIHSHLICTRCHRIIDYFDDALKDLQVPKSLWSGFEIKRTCVIFYGLCEDCREEIGEKKGDGENELPGRVVPFKKGDGNVNAYLTMKITQ